MAGHFWLESFHHTEGPLVPPFFEWSDLHHANIGWNERSRKALRAALASYEAMGREDLPPHRYIALPPRLLEDHAAQRYLANADWPDRLRRPAGLSLRGLHARAAGEPMRAALYAQLRCGAASIEVYYLNGQEMN